MRSGALTFLTESASFIWPISTRGKIESFFPFVFRSITRFRQSINSFFFVQQINGTLFVNGASQRIIWRTFPLCFICVSLHIYRISHSQLKWEHYNGSRKKKQKKASRNQYFHFVEVRVWLKNIVIKQNIRIYSIQTYSSR